MTRRWSLLLLSSILCILVGWVGEVKISFVGFLRKDDSLMLKLFIKFSFPMLTPPSLGREHMED
jgi:hypothetical protein